MTWKDLFAFLSLLGCITAVHCELDSPKSSLNRLQIAQNATLRGSYQDFRFHITPELATLHWLSVKI